MVNPSKTYSLSSFSLSRKSKPQEYTHGFSNRESVRSPLLLAVLRQLHHHPGLGDGSAWRTAVLADLFWSASGILRLRGGSPRSRVGPLAGQVPGSCTSCVQHCAAPIRHKLKVGAGTPTAFNIRAPNPFSGSRANNPLLGHSWFPDTPHIRAPGAVGRSWIAGTRPGDGKSMAS